MDLISMRLRTQFHVFRVAPIWHAKDGAWERKLKFFFLLFFSKLLMYFCPKLCNCYSNNLYFKLISLSGASEEKNGVQIDTHFRDWKLTELPNDGADYVQIFKQQKIKYKYWIASRLRLSREDYRNKITISLFSQPIIALFWRWRERERERKRENLWQTRL